MNTYTSNVSSNTYVIILILLLFSIYYQEHQEQDVTTTVIREPYDIIYKSIKYKINDNNVIQCC